MNKIKNTTTQTSYTQSNKKARLNWLDALKGLAILTVVLGHVLLGYVDNQAFPTHQIGLSIFKEWIYTWHMPFFFVLSGFSFALAYGKDGNIKWSKLLKQILKLVLVYLVFSLLYSGLKIVFAAFVDHAMDVSALLIELLLPNTLMWYLWVLVAFYFLFGAVYPLLYRSKIATAFLAAVLFTVSLYGRNRYMTTGLRLATKNLLCCSFFFLLGMVIYSYYAATTVKQNKPLVTLVGILSLIIVILFACYYAIFQGHYLLLPPYYKQALDNVGAIAISFSFIYLFTHIKKLGENIVLTQLGKASLFIYLFHTYMVTALKAVVLRTGFSNAWIAILLGVFIPTVVSYLLYWIFNKSIGSQYKALAK